MERRGDRTRVVHRARLIQNDVGAVASRGYGPIDKHFTCVAQLATQYGQVWTSALCWQAAASDVVEDSLDLSRFSMPTPHRPNTCIRDLGFADLAKGIAAQDATICRFFCGKQPRTSDTQKSTHHLRATTRTTFADLKVAENAKGVDDGVE
jgi:hypothetical protein